MRKKRSENLSLDVRSGREIQRWSKEQVLQVRLITQIGGFRYLEEIVSIRYDFVLCELFNLEPVKLNAGVMCECLRVIVHFEFVGGV